MGRLFKQAEDIHLHHPSGVHHHDPVRHLGHACQIVGDQQDRVSNFSFKPRIRSRFGPESSHQGRRRLVSDEQLGIAGHRHGDHRRWRIPRQWCGYSSTISSARANPAISKTPSSKASLLLSILMEDQAFGDLVTVVITGFREVIGSWKIEISFPRIRTISSSDRSEICRQRISPSTIFPRSGSNFKMEGCDTLPATGSPMPSSLFASPRESIPSTAGTAPSS